MVHEPTMGMHHDAIVLGEALREAIPGIQVHTLDIPWNPNLDYASPLHVSPDLQTLAPFDAVFLFEHLYGHSPLRSAKFTRKCVFVPNVEWVLPPDEAEILYRPPDVILYKNAFSRELCEQIPGFREVPIGTVTGWTSIDFSPGGHDAAEKSFRSFLHVKGLSDQKQSALVLETWLDHPEFPQLTVIASPHDNFHISVPLKAGANVEVIFRKLPTQELRRYQLTCGVHVYPSYAEGFGHSLNEARVCRSVLVTTGGPPMSDLVEHRETGFLVPVQDSDVTRLRRSMSYEIRASAFSDLVEEVLAIPERKLRDIGQCARDAYLQDKKHFHARIRETFGSSGLSPM